MKKKIRTYRAEILFIAAAVVFIYGIPLFLRIVGWDDCIVKNGKYYTHFLPCIVFLHIFVYTFLERRYLFPVIVLTLFLTGQGVLMYKEPKVWYSYHEGIDFYLFAGLIFTLYEFYLAVLTAFLGALCGMIRDRISETIQRKRNGDKS